MIPLPDAEKQMMAERRRFKARQRNFKEIFLTSEDKQRIEKHRALISEGKQAVLI